VDGVSLTALPVAPPMVKPVDVALSFFSADWNHIDWRGFSEDRLAVDLNGRAEVDRLLVCDPYRSLASAAKQVVLGTTKPPIAIREHGAVLRPLRLRLDEPTSPERWVARYEAEMRRGAERLGMERPAVISGHPLVAGFGRFEWARSVTYYAWDDWTASAPHEPWWPAYHEAFRRLRDTGRRVCAVTGAALETVAPTGPHAVIPNGVDPGEWEELGVPPAWFASKPGPRLLYVGALDSRVDAEQAAAVARDFPNGSLTFVGPLVDPGHFAALRELPNVEIHRAVPRADVPALIAAADVCLIPHVRNALTEAMSPLKLYEYLAGGRPVAAVDLPPIRSVGGRMALGPAGGDLAPAVRAALEMGPAGEEERLDFVRTHSWSRRFDELLALALAP
jgi:teichuronic acid biosynthesis glycosyltransferase TuaH